MPLPTPTKGEERNKFISRCISFAVDEGMPQKQAVAACHTSWRRAKGIKEPTQNKLQLKYQVPIREQGFINGDFIIEGVAINSTISSNNHKFLAEELEKSAVTLKGVPLLKDHENTIDSIMGRVLSGTFNEIEENVNFRAKVIDEKAKELIKDGRLNSVSIGADVENIEEQDGYFIPKGITFRELSLVAVPADEGATFQIALKEAYNFRNKELEEKDIPKIVGDTIREELKKHNQLNKKEVIKMSEEETKETETSEDKPAEVKAEEPKEEPKPAEPKEPAVTEEKVKSWVKEAIKEADADEAEPEKPKKPEKPKVEKEEEEEAEESEEVDEKYNIVRSSHNSFTLVR